MKINYSNARTPIAFTITTDSKHVIIGKITRAHRGYMLHVNKVQWTHGSKPRLGGLSCLHFPTILGTKAHLEKSVDAILVILEEGAECHRTNKQQQLEADAALVVLLNNNQVKFGLPNDTFPGYDFIGGFGIHNTQGSVSVHLPKYHVGRKVKVVCTDRYLTEKFPEATIIDTGDECCVIQNERGRITTLRTSHLELL